MRMELKSARRKLRRLQHLTKMPAPTATPQPQVPGVRYIDDPEVPYLKWEIGPEVPAEHYLGLRAGIMLMHSYAAFLGVPEPHRPATLYLYHDLDALAPAYARVLGETVDAARGQLATAHWTGRGGSELYFRSFECFVEPKCVDIRHDETFIT